MRRPRVATVLTAQPWEESFVALARRTGTMRIVTRAYRPGEVAASGAEMAVVGEETSWLGAGVLGLWAALGIRTVIVTSTSTTHLAHTSADPAEILRTVHGMWLDPQPPSEVVTVVGPSGSGVTEVACALAASWAPVHVVDEDPPAATLRLTPAGGPASGVTVSPEFPIEPAARTIVDRGRRGPLPRGRCVLVVAHTPLSVVRAARLIARWTGPVPDLVINMARDSEDATACAMANLGLEPRLLLGYDPAVAERAAVGVPPPAWFGDSLEGLLTPEDAPGPR